MSKERVTQEEKQRRLERILSFLAQEQSTGQIIASCRALWGLCERQVYRYLKDAKKYRRQRADEPWPESKARLLLATQYLRKRALQNGQLPVAEKTIRTELNILQADHNREKNTDGTASTEILSISSELLDALQQPPTQRNSETQ